MTRSPLTTLFIASLLLVAAAGPAADEDLLTTTQRFSFHSNPWINQHHFLYQTAKGTAPEDDLPPLEEAERQLLEEAVEHYRSEVIEHDLLFSSEMFNLKRWLIEQDVTAPLPSNEKLGSTVDWLNRTRQVYRQRLWPSHDASNRDTLARNLEDLKRIEGPAAERLADLSQTAWPEAPIRVDLSYYTNWAGAYTTVRPVPHAVVRSIDDGPRGDWVETLFHESSHALIGPNRGPVPETIARHCEELGMEVPRNLWHGFLFYFAGRVTEDLIEPITGEDYVQFMVRGSVFSTYLPHLEAYVEPYVRGEIDLDTAVRRTLESLRASSRQS